MTIRQFLTLYNHRLMLRVAAHVLFWALMWLFTENPDYDEPYAARLPEWFYSMASFYLLFYWPGPPLWARQRYGWLAAVGVGLVLSSGAVMYASEKIVNPETQYFLPEFEVYGPLAIFLSGRYFFYAVFNGLLANLAAPGVLKVAKLLYEHQLARQRTEQLTRQLQLDVLLGQVNPHFLFNTLNNLYGLVLHHDPRARPITQQLAALLHYSQALAGRQWVALREETSFIEDFLALARLRYGSQVTIASQWNFGPDADAHIPPLLLLPLVENAFKHGLNQAIGTAWVRVEGRVAAGEVVVTVVNSRAAAPQPATPLPGGLGLTTLQKRLRLLYPAAVPLLLHSTATTFEATLRLPLQRGMAATSAAQTLAKPILVPV